MFSFPLRASTPLPGWMVFRDPLEAVLLWACGISPDEQLAPEGIKGLSSQGAGMTSQGQPGGRGYVPSNRIQKTGCCQAQASLWVPFKSAALKIAQRSAQKYWISWVLWFTSQSSLISLFDYIIWFSSIIKMSCYWEVTVISGGAPWRFPPIFTISMKRCWSSGWRLA